MTGSPADRRRAELAKIHLAKKQLGLSDADYRAVLWAIGRVESSADLDDHGRRKLIAHFESRGFKPAPPRRVKTRPQARPAADKAALLAKLDAQLAEAGRPRAYADAIAMSRFKVARVEWLGDAQLYKIVQMLAVDAKRHGRTI